jgi:hypothetical protein
MNVQMLTLSVPPFKAFFLLSFFLYLSLHLTLFLSFYFPLFFLSFHLFLFDRFQFSGNIAVSLSLSKFLNISPSGPNVPTSPFFSVNFLPSADSKAVSQMPNAECLESTFRHPHPTPTPRLY